MPDPELNPNPSLTDPAKTDPAADPAKVVDPAAIVDPAASIIGESKPAAWVEYADDPAKTPEENAALKTAHDATKPAAEPPKKADEPAPLDFAKDVKLPEGFAVDQPTADKFTALLNDGKLSRAELAQKLVELQADSFKTLGEGRKKAWDDLQEDWKSKVQDDPEVGGAKLPAVQANIAYLLDTFGDRETRAVFDLTGAGNQLAMVKFLNKVGAKLREGGPVLGDPPVGEGSSAKSLYDNTPTLNP